MNLVQNRCTLQWSGLLRKNYNSIIIQIDILSIMVNYEKMIQKIIMTIMLLLNSIVL